MTSPFMLALLAALVGALPLATVALPAAALLFAVSFLMDWGVLYLVRPATNLPFLGAPGVLALLWMVVGAVYAAATRPERRDRYGGRSVEHRPALFAYLAPVAFALAYVGVAVSGWPLFHAEEYAALAGEVPTREWTREIQPKDPTHMILVPFDTAMYEAAKSVSRDGAIGSQFSLDREHATLQRVRGRMRYEVPLEFNGFRTWSATGSVPGWIEVDAEDPDAPTAFPRTGVGRPITFTPGAFGSHDLERAVRDAGYADQVAGVRFEIDEENRPWWVVTLSRPLHGWDGDALTTVLVVDPSTGVPTASAPGNTPSFVDAPVPAGLVREWLGYDGELAHGAWNAWWDKLALTEPESPNLVAGNDERPVWVTGMTSQNTNDQSLVSLVYTDPRTGRSVRYAMSGGATEAAAQLAADHNSDIGFRHLSAAVPQVYNVEGVATAVMPLVNATGAFQGVALARLANVQRVSWGTSLSAAVAAYKAGLFQDGQQASLDNGSRAVSVQGTVDRIAPVVGSGDTYQFHLRGVGRIYTAKPTEAPALGLTQAGDQVSFDTVDSPAVILPAVRFRNASLPLDLVGDPAPAAVADPKAVR